MFYSVRAMRYRILPSNLSILPLVATANKVRVQAARSNEELGLSLHTQQGSRMAYGIAVHVEV